MSELEKEWAKEGKEIWPDEKGNRVEILSFFSKVYVDEEVEKLTREYATFSECDGEIRPSSLGKAQIESLAAKILCFVRVSFRNGISLIGLKKAELEMAAKREGEHWYLEGLIQNGFLREKWIKGDLVVFPTAKLLENQRIPKSKF